MYKPNFFYFHKRFLMRSSEYKLYKLILSFLDPQYVLLPQVHLDELASIPPKLGKQRLFFLRYINQRSVDFVICKKESMTAVLAIELDDSSHNKPDRIKRDQIVASILQQAKLPLLRISSKKASDEEFVRTEIENQLNQ